MQLWAHINLWEYHHPNSNFFDEMEIDPRIDKQLLLECMLAEIGELEIVDHSVYVLYRHFQIFFRKWAIPIKQLMDTTEYEYDPMVNFDYQVTRNLGRNVVRDLGRDIIRELTQAIKENLIGKVIYDEDTSKEEGRNRTDNFSGTESNTHTDDETIRKTGTHDATRHNTQNSTTHNEGYYDEEHEDTDTQTSTETTRHYVSAYNQITPNDEDTYSDRDVMNGTKTVNTKGKIHHGDSAEGNARDEGEITDDIDTTENSTGNKTGEYSTTTVNEDSITENVNTSGTKDSTENKTEDTTTNRTDNETTTTSEDETTDTTEDEDTHKVGIDRITHQELVEEQRKVVQFCIINWIIDRIAKEFVVGVW